MELESAPSTWQEFADSDVSGISATVFAVVDRVGYRRKQQDGGGDEF